MENQEYLNQIAASSAPVKKPGGGGLSDKILNIVKSKFFLIGMIGLVGLILIMIVGSLLTPKKVDVKTEILKFRLHVDNTASVVNEYQPNVKSSKLRSFGASLQAVLSSTSSDVTGYLSTKYGYKESKKDKKIIAAADEAKTELSDELFKAKINGILDRVFAHKMTYEISMFMNEEDSLIKIAKDETLTSILKQSHSSLEKLYDSFNNFSETNNQYSETNNQYSETNNQ